MDIQQKIVPFEIKSTSGDGSTGEGIGNAFHLLDAYNEIVTPGAFAETIPQFLQNGFLGGINHDWDNPIGTPQDAKEVQKGLWLSWKIAPTRQGKDAMILLQERVVKKLSIGFRTLGSEVLETSDDVKSYWEQHKYEPSAEDIAKSEFGARLLTKIHLYEVSPVTVPANMGSDITRVKCDIDSFERLAQMEEWLRDEAHFSWKDAKAFISRVKAFLRDVGDDENPKTSDTGTTQAKEVPSRAALYAEFLRRQARLRTGV